MALSSFAIFFPPSTRSDRLPAPCFFRHPHPIARKTRGRLNLYPRMSLFSFYREESPEPPSITHPVVNENRAVYANIDFHRSLSGCNLASFFGTPRLRPISADLDGSDLSDGGSIDTLELNREGLGKEAMWFEASKLGHHNRVSEARTLCPSIGPMSLPIELWGLIFSFVTPGAEDESFPRLADLLSCALTCRVCDPM